MRFVYRVCGPLWLSFHRLSSAGISTMASNGAHSVAYVTAPSEEVAKKLAKGIVSGKLAACVNIIPKVTSIYEWKGEISEDAEVLMMVKTRTSRVEQLVEFIRKNHPYELPEVISLPIQKGNPPYLDWISEIVPENNE
ncbi:protein CutA homolog isoform X2 [Ischnura elegans]|uniref:protein CutA homolog isoform X2 n=1 Tax=Ischnura elegans TaxID=197161 RepID=UPI001ED88EB2|nr:protein CutA homolog isoform X2 [Ischnura elegans]